jgi:hypothetical protein
MLKVREHLASLGPLMKDPEGVQVVVKAYANLTGISYACVRDKKIRNGEMSQFWVGFSRLLPMVEFVDVGPGKEEADNKIRGEKF